MTRDIVTRDMWIARARVEAAPRRPTARDDNVAARRLHTQRLTALLMASVRLHRKERRLDGCHSAPWAMGSARVERQRRWLRTQMPEDLLSDAGSFVAGVRTAKGGWSRPPTERAPVVISTRHRAPCWAVPATVQWSISAIVINVSKRGGRGADLPIPRLVDDVWTIVEASVRCRPRSLRDHVHQRPLRPCRGSKSQFGKQVPWRSLVIASSRVPAPVSQSRSR